MDHCGSGSGCYYSVSPVLGSFMANHVTSLYLDPDYQSSCWQKGNSKAHILSRTSIRTMRCFPLLYKQRIPGEITRSSSNYMYIGQSFPRFHTVETHCRTTEPLYARCLTGHYPPHVTCPPTCFCMRQCGKHDDSDRHPHSGYVTHSNTTPVHLDIFKQWAIISN